MATAQQIELLPADLGGQVFNRLQHDMLNAVRMRAVVAYWTMNPGQSPDLARVIGGTGFLCVDIHRPTDIDYLAQLRRAGGQVYLHLFDLSGHTEDLGIKGLPPYLLHAKTLLFDMPDGNAALWVGSHNWTQRALFGINVEASLRVYASGSDDLIRSAEVFLDGARQRCTLLNPSEVGYYKWLQGDDGAENVIEVEDPTGGPIPASITVFGTQLDEHHHLRTVEKEVLLSVTAPDGSERFYRAAITGTGHADKGQTFGPRRWCFRQGKRLPVLEPVSPVPDRVMRSFRYYASLRVDEVLPAGTRAIEPLTGKKWTDVPGENPELRLPPRSRTGKRGDAPPRIRAAIRPENIEQRDRSLAFRKADRNRGFVMRLVVIIPEDGPMPSGREESR